MIKSIFVNPLLTSWLANVSEDRVSGITLSLDDANVFFIAVLGSAHDAKKKRKERGFPNRRCSLLSHSEVSPSAISLHYRKFAKPFLLFGQSFVTFYTKQRLQLEIATMLSSPSFPL